MSERAPAVAKVSGTPFGIAVSQDNTLFVSDWNKNTVTAINPQTGAELRKVEVGRSPAGIVTSPRGALVFVANRESDSLTILNATTLSVVATIPVGRAPFALAVSPDGTRVYVANVQSANLSVISTDTLRTIKTVPVGHMPYGVATTIDGARILVSNQSSGSVAFIDSREMRVLQQAKVGRFPEGIVVEPRGSKAYVANWFSGDVSVLDVATRAQALKHRRRRAYAGGGCGACVAKWASGRRTPMKRARRRLTQLSVSTTLLCLVAAGASAGGDRRAHKQGRRWPPTLRSGIEPAP